MCKIYANFIIKKVGCGSDANIMDLTSPKGSGSGIWINYTEAAS
jgi:hypothetical protein